jgi:hypothetical protein
MAVYDTGYGSFFVCMFYDIPRSGKRFIDKDIHTRYLYWQRRSDELSSPAGRSCCACCGVASGFLCCGVFAFCRSWQRGMCGGCAKRTLIMQGTHCEHGRDCEHGALRTFCEHCAATGAAAGSASEHTPELWYVDTVLCEHCELLMCCGLAGRSAAGLR